MSFEVIVVKSSQSQNSKLSTHRVRCGLWHLYEHFHDWEFLVIKQFDSFFRIRGSNFCGVGRVGKENWSE